MASTGPDTGLALGPFPPGFVQRFRAKTAPFGDCLLWRGRPDRSGYGRCVIPRDRPGPYGQRFRYVYAHRVAYALACGGELPPGVVVRHTCDRPLCVAEGHLVDGSQADNIRDRDTRGRFRCRNGHRFATRADYYFDRTGKRKCMECARATTIKAA